jgi:RimJ/RimL family protein N-acetyltransferase
MTRIELQVRADNGRAIRLYERMGVEREGTLRRAMRFDGAYYVRCR